MQFEWDNERFMLLIMVVQVIHFLQLRKHRKKVEMFAKTSNNL